MFNDKKLEIPEGLEIREKYEHFVKEGEIPFLELKKFGVRNQNGEVFAMACEFGIPFKKAIYNYHLYPADGGKCIVFAYLGDFPFEKLKGVKQLFPLAAKAWESDGKGDTAGVLKVDDVDGKPILVIGRIIDIEGLDSKARDSLTMNTGLDVVSQAFNIVEEFGKVFGLVDKK